MKILMTGGTGFIGQQFISTFTEHKYTVLSRNARRARITLPHTNVEIIEALDEIKDFDSFDAIINLAGEPIIDKRWTDSQKKRIEDSRWQITRDIVQRIQNSDNPPKIFLSGSAIGFYGNQGSSRISEASETQGEAFSTKLCVEWENIASQVADKTRLVLLRTGIVLHPDFGALNKMILPFKLGLGGNVSNGEHYFSWIHWQDMIHAMHFLLINDDCQGAYNMTAPQPCTNADFTTALGKVLHRPTLFTVPAFGLKLLLGEGAELLLDSQRVLPMALQGAGFEFTYHEAETALENLLD
ncbi:MAG: TIGR01777 family protein [Enterobacterales bacterium]|nr:TIGR01777 family protein [Enterobacterales bacterium]